jgi:hypothetical protein
MMRLVVGVGALIALPALAGAEAGSQFSGKYRLSQPRHTGKANKIDSFTVKQGTRAFNPKEFKLDEKAQWRKTPKSKTLCTTPDGKPRAC